MKENQDLFAAISLLEGNLYELEDIQNLLTVFDECLWKAGNATEPEAQAAGVVYKQRFPVLYSTLTIIRLRLGEVLADMNNNVNACYSNYNQLKEEQPTSD